jgi:transposase
MTEPIASRLARKIQRNKDRGQRLSEEEEDRIVKAYLLAGATYRSVARDTRHGVGTVMRVVRRRQEEGEAAAESKKGNRA